jgi:2-polyprenyl-3-methyl-5-hydroxy-6-metoxy-1,4-benzoquinol methylase
MSQFDASAREWDNNPVHWERSDAIALLMKEIIPIHPGMKAMEFGAGTGILSFLLQDQLSEIMMMDSSGEMVKVMQEKVEKTGLFQLKPLFFDLEAEDYSGDSFDLIFTQMAMHHVGDIGEMVAKFHQLLNRGGWLAIADLYAEDGTFHSPGFTGHMGFEPEKLVQILSSSGFEQISIRPCYTVKKMIGEQLKDFPVFLLTALK